MRHLCRGRSPVSSCLTGQPPELAYPERTVSGAAHVAARVDVHAPALSRFAEEADCGVSLHVAGPSGLRVKEVAHRGDALVDALAPAGPREAQVIGVCVIEAPVEPVGTAVGTLGPNLARSQAPC